MYFAHLTYSGSPLSIRLVELTRAQYRRTEKRRIARFNKLISPGSDQTAINDLIDEEENWLKFLRNPMKLVEYVKQYHCADDSFFVVTAVQFTVLFYLAFKAIFHRFVIGSDKTLADHYADRYLPRVFHSYSDSHNIQTFLFSLCTYIFIRRFMRFYALIRNSIINRAGYKYITHTQLNYSAASALEIPLHEWLDFVPIALKHHKDCTEDEEIKRQHLSFGPDIEEAINKSPIEFIHFQNPISFDRCFDGLHTRFSPKRKSPWAKDWYIPVPLLRMDIFESGLLIVLAVFGMVLSTIIITYLLVSSFLYELCAIALDNHHESCLAGFTTFVLSPSRIIRAIDHVLVMLVILPQIIEGSSFLWDCCAMISRTRKIIEALQEDIEYCNAKCHLSGAIDITTKDKKELNHLIWIRIQLTRCIVQEFRDLKAVYAVYLNVLLIGGGLLISISVTEILVSDSIFEKFILQGFVIGATIELILSLLSSIFTEIAVSMTKYY